MADTFLDAGSDSAFDGVKTNFSRIGGDAQRMADLKPTVVHECDRCHATVTPAESGQGVNVSGVVQCKVCGHVGPLCIKVVIEDNR
jgi:hypothetical protein